MVQEYFIRLIASFFASLAGCGTYVPDIELSREPHATAFLINKIVNHVKYELRDAIHTTVAYDEENPAQHQKTRGLKWLDSMNAKVTIKPIVDEKGTLNPGVTLKQLLPSQITTFNNKTV